MQVAQTESAPAFRAESDLFSNDEAARYLGVEPRTLEVWRCLNRYEISYVRVGRLVKYRRSDLDKWLASRTVNTMRAA